MKKNIQEAGPLGLGHRCSAALMGGRGERRVSGGGGGGDVTALSDCKLGRQTHNLYFRTVNRSTAPRPTHVTRRSGAVRQKLHYRRVPRNRRTVQRCLSLRVLHAARSGTVFTCPFIAARCSSVQPSSVVALHAAALCFNKTSIASTWFQFAAWCSGVQPSVVVILHAAALCSNRSFAIAARPFLDAQCKGVAPCLSCIQHAAASHSNRALAVSTCPSIAAQCNGVQPSSAITLHAA